MRKTIAAIAMMVLAACDSSGDGNNILAEANASGNAAGAAVQNEVGESGATPLQKDQALALMKQRHENYEKIGDAMKGIGRELKAESPDLAEVRSGAAVIAGLAPQVPGWFPAGTGQDVGKTDALDEIWMKPEDFAAKAKAFRESATAFNTAAQGSDLASIRAAHANLGKSCKTCHDLYREKE
ncbi:MAG: cytochrome c [Sphingosinicella sp.]|nr:cytochrome c [Sphingosinicella sp.]